MWNLNVNNRKCNEHERTRDHKMHLERIVMCKTAIKIKPPMKPSFLAFKAKKQKMEEERNMQIGKDNLILFDRIVEITKKPSAYNPINLRPKDCPAFSKTTYRRKTEVLDVDKDNVKLYKRLLSARPHYKTKEYIQDYDYQIYLEQMISTTKTDSYINPNMKFETPGSFKKKLTQYLVNEDNIINSSRPYTAQRFYNPALQSELPGKSLTLEKLNIMVLK